MAREAIGLPDFLHIQRAHLIGVSMGGMISQRLAISYPDWVLTLTSIMSSGHLLNPAMQSTLSGKFANLLTPFLLRNRTIRNKLTDPVVDVDNSVATYRFLAGMRHPYEEARYRALIYHSQEVANQFIRLLAGDVAELQERLLKLAYQSVRKRMAEALIMYQHKFYPQVGDPAQPDNPDAGGPATANTSLPMTLSHENWSHLVGASTETAIRILSDLRASKAIESVAVAIKVASFDSKDANRDSHALEVLDGRREQTAA